MSRLKIYAATILALSAALSFTACNKNDIPDIETTSAEQTSTTLSNGYTYNDVIFTMEPISEYIHVAPPLPTHHKIEKTEKSENNESKTTANEFTSRKNQSDKVEEISNGINILSKSSPVIKGNNVSIVITGTPGASYIIEFYETETKKAAYPGLEVTKADYSGIASWNFKTEESCEPGNRKVIIREKNSDKYIQTAITVY